MCRKIITAGIILVSLLSYSCGDQGLNKLKMGDEYIDDESGIVLIDTFSVETSTVLIDSIQTSGSASALTGAYHNPYFGDISIEPVFRITLPDNYSFVADDVFDSITICMNYNGYYLGDTTQLHTLYIKELHTDFDNMEQTTFYNTSTVQVKDETLGELSYYPYPTKNEVLECKLNDSFGKNMFALFMNKAEEVSNLNNFQDYLKGIVIQGNNTANQSIIGFAAADTSMYIKMYYHRIEEEKEELELILPMENSNYSFNSVRTYRDETLFAALKKQEEDILSKETANISLIQGASGIMTKVKFPGLASVFQLVKLNQIIKAELILVPTRESEDMNDLPQSLIVYESNNINALNNIILASDGYTPLTLQLHPAQDNFEDKPYYSIDITSYIIENLLTGYFDPNNALIVSLPNTDVEETVRTLMLGGELNTDYKPKLKLYTYFY